MKLEPFVHCTSSETIRLTEDSCVPDHLRAYLEWEPSKERTYRGWRFLAPDQIVRSASENFYHVAMHRMPNAVETLSWRRDLDKWQVRTYMDTGESHEERPLSGSIEDIVRRLEK